MSIFSNLFGNQRAYTRLPTASIIRPKRWRLITIIKYAAIIIISIVITFFAICQLQLNIRVYLRNWISHADDAYYAPLAGCFDKLPKDSPYLTGQNHYVNDLSPGISLMEDYDCYDFAATIQPKSTNSKDTIIYHAYWRADLAPVGPKQLSTLRSFFATQNPNNTIVYLWSNGDLSQSPVIKEIKKHVGDRLQTKIYDSHELSKGTPMENSPHLDFKDASGYLDGDLIRLLVIYHYGGMWFDMDSLFIRDMSPLLEQEWLLQWDCYLPNGFPFNGAFMRFHKESPYLCEMLSELASGPLPRPNTIDWGGYMYYRIYRRLLHHGIRPWSVLPWCFTDSMVCSPKNSMPNAFIEAEFSKERLLKTFAYHWHNQWKKEPGSLFRFLDEMHKNTTGW
ncbi:hypothetical protein G6F70_008080 [Rhizopus microsporus]|uniref:Glycosyltransferase family 32 protein n=1 Tax=Rhizopus microsporus TaxID=58291 RepID=A0A0A1NES8_RHIZD|nr:hypothetical protein G6F71_009074 [Rhizopus microsporus]KAG1195640.1 hypothetical protein G6F70_008080 [Rhizopus microsporus]KAG1207475.1 hypothetical protein G6F69_008018 [Rhizopus microsporus]KAG1228349.1 hypothetical protein G6F67_007878 [Rhizopus microsporus]KAG1260210.1 hypothetical protein G6F68_007594 [Rhizopus microsporus]